MSGWEQWARQPVRMHGHPSSYIRVVGWGIGVVWGSSVCAAMASRVCVRAVSSRVGEAAGDVGLRKSRMSAARKPVLASMADCSWVVLFAKFADARALA